MDKQPKDKTKCSHKINFSQVANFGRDKCEICGEWVRKGELIGNRMKQIRYLLEEIEKLTIG